jgi:hypothetical protein
MLRLFATSSVIQVHFKLAFNETKQFSSAKWVILPGRKRRRISINLWMLYFRQFALRGSFPKDLWKDWRFLCLPAVRILAEKIAKTAASRANLEA